MTIIPILSFLILILSSILNIAFAMQPALDVAVGDGSPYIKDSNLRVETVSEGLKLPTNIGFLDKNVILVLEKDKGTVQRIVNGNISPEPILDVNVANKNERGMLGIAVSTFKNDSNYVFLYYTESVKDGNDDCPNPIFAIQAMNLWGNRLYRYEYKNGKLLNPTLLLDLPATPGPSHNGGSLIIGPDNNLYLSIGDVGRSVDDYGQSIQNISSLDGRGGILRVTQDGEAVGQGILGSSHPLNLYYAYGLRNSYGIDFDPITGNLWDTENGPNYGDEINLVEPGFNSGWDKVQGIWPVIVGDPSIPNKTDFEPKNLLEFGGKSNYSLPELTWAGTVGPTAIKFLDTDKLGKQYQNDIFVGDVHNGNLYHFDLDKLRKGLLLKSSLVDKVIDADTERQGIIFGKDFGGYLISK